MQSTFNVPSIHCNHCAHTIKVELGDLVGVTAIDVNVNDKTVQVSYDDSLTDEAIKNLLAEIGYPAE
jgi:copper ion binding protein